MARKENYEPFKPTVDLGTILVDLLNSKQNNGVSQTTPSGSSQNGNKQKENSSMMPSDDPQKYLNSVIVAAVAPLVAQHAAEAYQQTGQVPDASSVMQLQVQQQINQEQPQQQQSTNIDQNQLLQQAGVKQGLLSSLLGRNLNPSYVDEQLSNISNAQKITGQEPLQAKDKLLYDYRKSEEEYRQKEIELKNLQIDQLKKGNQPMNEEQLFTENNIPMNEREDYIVKPVKQTIRGILQTVPIVERKKSLPAKNLDDLATLDNSRQDLSQVVERLKNSGLQLGPGLSTTPGAISDMLGQIKGSEFAGIKADIGRNFQMYRKWATGVAAGYPELNMLAPNYPKATDTNAVFIQKSIDVMKDIERQRGIMLDYFSNGGYAVSKLRGVSDNKPISSSGWTNEKEKRYQELRKKMGK